MVGWTSQRQPESHKSPTDQASGCWYQPLPSPGPLLLTAQGLREIFRMELLSSKDSWRRGGQVGAGLVSSRTVRLKRIPRVPCLLPFFLPLSRAAGPCHFPRGHCPHASPPPPKSASKRGKLIHTKLNISNQGKCATQSKGFCLFLNQRGVFQMTEF